MSIGGEPSAASGKVPDPQTPINAAKPEAATQTPADPTGAVSQAVEKAEDGLTTKEKREEKVAATESAAEGAKKD
jgi:hypothetical protein